MTAAALLARAATGTRMVSLVYTTRETGEVARYLIVPGATLETLYRRDAAWLERAYRFLSRIAPEGAATVAVGQVLASRAVSLETPGENPAATAAHAYDSVAPGLKVHRESGEVHVSGVLVGKVVLTPGTPRKPVAHRTPVTAAKHRVRYMVPSAKWRQFRLADMGRVAAEGEVLVLG